MSRGAWFGLIALVSLLLAVTLIAWLAGANNQSADDFNQGLGQLSEVFASMRWWLTALRAAIVGIVIWQWHRVTLWAYPDSVPDCNTRRAALYAWRWRVLWGFVLIEVLLVHNLLGVLIGRVA